MFFFRFGLWICDSVGTSATGRGYETLTRTVTSTITYRRAGLLYWLSLAFG